MGHTNSTANLALPQFIGTDKPTWLSDVNGAFAAIDAYAGNNDAALAITDAKADTAISDAAGAVTTAGNASTTAGNAAATATAANTVAGNALTVANGINSKVGVLTDLTTIDKSTVVNAINEVNAKDAGDIAYDNTGSGLTATNVQDAIDEVAQGGGGGGTSAGISLIWTNPNPSSSFAGDTVTVTTSKTFDAIMVSDETGYTFTVAVDGNAAQVDKALISAGSGVMGKVSRSYTATNTGSGISVVISNGTQVSVSSYGTAGSSSADSVNFKPIMIFGIEHV